MAGVMGVELFATRYISFMVEYGMDFIIGSESEEQKRTGIRDAFRAELTEERHENFIRFTPADVKFGVSFYF